MALTKVVLIGGTKRALKTFNAILELNHPEIEIPLCIFMPGHEDELEFCKKLEALASKNNIPYVTSHVINQDIVQQLRAVSPHAMIGLGVWRSMISAEVLTIPEFGYLGLHGTPLPRLRGFAGTYWQIINGYDEIKTRFYRLDPGIDSGPYVCDQDGNVLEYSISINNEKHLEEIFEDYDLMHIKANLDFLEKLVRRNFTFKDQPQAEATYACHRGADDGEINWNEDTKKIFDFIRAQSSPCPGAFTYFDNKKIAIWKAKPRYDYVNYEGRIPGKIVSRFKKSGSVVILTANGGIEVEKITCEDEGFRPYDIFDSVRHKCQSATEAKLNKILLSLV